MHDLLYPRSSPSQSFLFVMVLGVVEESMYIIDAMSGMKELKISVYSLPAVGSHALDYPKHIPIN